MKNRLNITIDETLIEEVKRYAEKNNKSLSQIIEESLQKLVILHPAKKQNILDLLENLPKPKISFKYNSREVYYKEKNKKGF